MNYNTIYKASFNDIVLGDRIDIYIKQEGYNGPVEDLILDNNPLTISYPTKEFDYQIFGCGAEINIINDSGDFYKYDSLFSVPERSNYIEIIKTTKAEDASMYIFQGYILPDLYTSRLGKNIHLTIPATDRLSTLDRYVPWVIVDTSTFRSREYNDALSMITSVLYDADVTNILKVNNTLQNINYRRDVSDNTILNNIFFQADNFQTNEQVENSKTVLEKILQPLYSRVYYYNGAWHIDRVQDLTKKRYYTVYPKDTSTYGEVVEDTIIDLSCEDSKTVANTAELSFHPGNSKLIVNLKYKKPPSLVENWWYGFSYYSKEVSVNSNLPLPAHRRWMTSEPTGFTIRPNVSFPGIDKGFLMGKQIFAFPSIPDDAWYNMFFSTMFLFTPTENTATDPTIINIEYKRGFHPEVASVYTNFSDVETQDKSVLLGRFALRACDRNGNDHWIAKSHPDDTSTYWSNVPYTFDASITWGELKENNYIWEIKERVDISDPIVTDVSIISYNYLEHTNEGYWFYPFIEARPRDTWVTKTYEVPSKTQYIGELYLDVYDTFHNYRGNKPVSPSGWYYGTYFGTNMGDFNVQATTPEYPDMLEADMGYFYNIIEKDLHIFDVSVVQYTNGVYNMDDNGTFRSIFKWRDKPIEPYMLLQYQYVNDLAQQLAYPRYRMNIDIVSTDSSLFSVGHLYRHDTLKYTDGTDIIFMCNGLEYNVIQNTYRLDLEEFIADESYRLPEIIKTFYYEPDNLTYTWNGAAINNEDTIDISTNMYYNVTASDPWINWTIDVSEHVKVNLDNNLGGSRDGSLYITPTDNVSRFVNIHQDTSANVKINIVSDPGNKYLAYIDLSDIPSGQNIDVSVYGQCTAYAESDLYYCGQTSASASLDVSTSQIASCATAPVNCGESSYVNDSGTITFNAIDKNTVITLKFTGTDLYQHNDGESLSTGKFEISAKYTGTGTSIGFINNKISWSGDHIPYIN